MYFFVLNECATDCGVFSNAVLIHNPAEFATHYSLWYRCLYRSTYISFVYCMYIWNDFTCGHYLLTVSAYVQATTKNALISCVLSRSRSHFLPRDASAQRGYEIACRPSVTYRYRDQIQIGWNSSKIISRPNSLRPIRSLTPNGRSDTTETSQKLGLNRGGVRST